MRKIIFVVLYLWCTQTYAEDPKQPSDTTTTAPLKIEPNALPQNKPVQIPEKPKDSWDLIRFIEKERRYARSLIA